MSNQPKGEQPNPTNQESSGANKVGVANSGQNQFPLKKEARESAEQNAKANPDELPSAGSQVRDAAKHVDSGRNQQDQD